MIISPSPRAAVCCVGDRLEVICTATGSGLMWNLTVVGATHSITRTLSTIIRHQEVVMINSVTIIFSRDSELGDMPSVSIGWWYLL